MDNITDIEITPAVAKDYYHLKIYLNGSIVPLQICAEKSDFRHLIEVIDNNINI